MENKISLTEIKRILNNCLNSLENEGVNSVILNDDYYWDIDEADLYNPNQEPTRLSIGQLSEDLDFLRKAELEHCFTTNDLKKISSILRYFFYTQIK